MYFNAMMKEKYSCINDLKVPTKRSRQERFRADVAKRGLSAEAATDEARFIPREMVHQFKALRWPR
jgi:hypothetical protein